MSSTMYINEPPNILSSEKENHLRQNSQDIFSEKYEKIDLSDENSSDIVENFNNEDLYITKTPEKKNMFTRRSPKTEINTQRRHSTALNILGLGGKSSPKETKETKEPKEPKGNRRSSLALFGSSGNKDSLKDFGKPERRSSLAITILGGKRDSLYNKSQSSLPDDSDEKRSRYRKSSWQQRLDRKRRMGVPGVPSGLLSSSSSGTMGSMDDILDEEPQPMPRQKRNSWWNIFVPDQKKLRSRRASQDVNLLSRSADNLAPWPRQRSKSRSVDHGLTAPFDLDSLRSKVEGRFESVDRLARIAQIPTIPYTVGDRDTLTSVAAHFDTTPSELTAINRLGSSFVFPGQVLQVPCKDGAQSEDGEGVDGGSSSSTPTEISHENHDDLPPEEKELLDGLRPSSPKPGRIERIKTPLSGGSAPADDDPALTQRFLKINVRHITDGQGVVGGVLLVTPNAVMFDPNVSDPLVIEHGPESYGVIAPMDLVVNAAIYHDIAHMRVGHIDAEIPDIKPEIYHSPKSCTHSPGKDSLLVKDETFPELGGVEGDADGESVCSCAEQREGDAFPKAFERDLVTPTNLQQSQGESTESEGTGLNAPPSATPRNTLEDRRRSLLDQHWAIPSKDRSLEDEVQEPAAQVPIVVEEVADENALVKQSCHDSGIDIRDPIPIVPTINTKKVYSDADIVLSSDWVPPITIAATHLSHTPPMPMKSGDGHNSDSLDSNESTRKKTSSVSFSLEDSAEEKDDKPESKKNKMLKRLSYPLAWVEGLTGSDEAPPTSATPPSSGDSHHTSMFSKVFSRRSSIGTFMRDSGSSAPPKPPRAPAPRLDYRSMVSIDDMPELFVSFDKLIPRPARACADPPLYLRLRMGRPLNGPAPKQNSVMSYGKKKMRPEYWFSVPRNRVDDLYRFLHVWVPHLYGELNEAELLEKGYELINHDTDWGDGEDSPHRERKGSDDEISELTRESWEVLSMNEDLRRALYSSPSASLDVELAVPELVGDTEILSDEHREKLCRHLPARAEGYLWSLVFSTSQHGFSLNSMYRKMHRLESPILMVIQDTENNVFGALTSCSLKVSEYFYGTGESLLFKFNPTFRVFHWSGENLYFIKGNNESIAIGAGDGKFGLWLDGDLYQGRSQRCSTYANEPLSPQEDFVVKILECWAFL